MKNFILLPDGNAVSPAVIKSVTHYEGKGVILRDAQNRHVSYLQIENDIHGRLARDLIIKTIDEGSKAIQPDWSFLN